jgi:hypothetical protein
VHGAARGCRLHRRHREGLALGDGFQKPFEEPAAIGSAMRRFDDPLGVRHQPEDVSGIVQDSRDPPGRPVDLIEIAECDAALTFEAVESRFVRLIIPVMVGDREDDRFPESYWAVKRLWLFSTRSETGRQTKLRRALRISAPGSSPASVRTWKPLQIPISGTPRLAASFTARMIGERAAIAPERR